jgi:hypothetical protein
MKVDKVGKKELLILSLQCLNNCLMRHSTSSMDNDLPPIYRGAFLSLSFIEMLVEELLELQSPCKLEKNHLKGLVGLL